MGNEIGISPNLSESLTSEDIEEVERRTVGNGDQEDINWHPTLTSSTTEFILTLDHYHGWTECNG